MSFYLDSVNLRHLCKMLTILFGINGNLAFAIEECKTDMNITLNVPGTHISEFNRTLDTFLKAVANRKFDVFQKMLSSELPFWALLPGGKIYTTSDEFIKSQRPWFEKKIGEFNYKILNSSVGIDSAWTLVEVDLFLISESESTGVLKKIFITFGFRYHNSNWFLVHDQNTVVSEEVKKL